MKLPSWLHRWQRSENSSDRNGQQPKTLAFTLIYGHNEIGVLELSKDQWHFIYSDWFKNQSEFEPFANFPDVNREYVSNDLPPFFESRLPGTSQPQVEAFLKKTASILSGNEGATKAALLKEFGRRAITNPFELNPTF